VELFRYDWLGTTGARRGRPDAVSATGSSARPGHGRWRTSSPARPRFPGFRLRPVGPDAGGGCRLSWSPTVERRGRPRHLGPRASDLTRTAVSPSCPHRPHPLSSFVFSSLQERTTAVTVSGVDCGDRARFRSSRPVPACGLHRGATGGQVGAPVENFCPHPGRPHPGRVVHRSIPRCGWGCPEARARLGTPGDPRSRPDISQKVVAHAHGVAQKPGGSTRRRAGFLSGAWIRQRPGTR
jgi:hypothetical protein